MKNLLFRTVKNGLSLPEDLVVIDAHAHVDPPCVFGTVCAHEQGLLEPIRRFNVKAVYVTPIDSILTDTIGGNTRAMELVARYGGRVRGYMVVNPNHSRKVSEQELNRCLLEGNLEAIKLHSFFHDHPLDGPGYEPALEFADEFHLCVLSHTWDSPDTLCKLAEKYPNAFFYVAHFTGNLMHRPETRKYIDITNAHPNIYLDTTSSAAPLGAVEYTVEAVGADRVIFGTDYNWLSFEFGFGKILYADLDDESKRKILGLNFQGIIQRSLLGPKDFSQSESSKRAD
ncbi:MAG TPA: amidohydrolase family protein [bacterium]|nr:amidohydrolase family protein [bacterium]